MVGPPGPVVEHSTAGSGFGSCPRQAPTLGQLAEEAPSAGHYARAAGEGGKLKQEEKACKGAGRTVQSPSRGGAARARWAPQTTSESPASPRHSGVA